MSSITHYQFINYNCEFVQSKVLPKCIVDDQGNYHNNNMFTDIMFTINKQIEVQSCDKVSVCFRDHSDCFIDELPANLLLDDDSIKDILASYIFKPLAKICYEYIGQIFIIDMDGKWLNNQIAEIKANVCVNNIIIDDVEYFINCISCDRYESYFDVNYMLYWSLRELLVEPFFAIQYVAGGYDSIKQPALKNMKFSNIVDKQICDGADITDLKSMVGAKYRYSDVIDGKTFVLRYRCNTVPDSDNNKMCIFLADDKLIHVHECLLDRNTTVKEFYDELVKKLFLKDVDLFKKRWSSSQYYLTDVYFDIDEVGDMAVDKLFSNNDVVYYPFGSIIWGQIYAMSYNPLRDMQFGKGFGYSA